MSFAILRHAKISNATKGGAIAHNHRHVEGEQVNIEPALKHLNQYFFGEGAKGRIDEKLPGKMRKDAVISVEILLTASPEWFDGLEKDRAKLAKNPVFLDWVKRSKKWAETEFGVNLVDLTLHMDESTPHLHALTVPLTKDGRLCAKEITARTEMQRRQTGYAKAMEKFGLKRGDPAIETKRRHIGLKEAPGAGGQASQLASQLAASQAELVKVQKRFDNLQKLSMGDMAAISELKKKVETMATKITQLTEEKAELAAQAAKWAAKANAYQAEKAKGVPGHLIDTAAVRAEPSKTAQAAFAAKWVDIPMATPGQASVGTVVDVLGRQVVYHVGQGRHVMQTVEPGKALPVLDKTQQQKSGVAR